MYPLWVLEWDVESIETHKARVEELMQFEREKCAEYNNSPWMAFMSLNKLLIACILAKDAKEEYAEEEVTEVFNEQREGCAIEYKGDYTICG